MNRIALVTGLLLISSVLWANWTWARSIGHSGMERAWDMAVDNNNNIIIVGEFTDSLSIDGVDLYSLGLSDSFVLKLDRFGNLLWARGLSSADEDVALAVGSDVNGNVYVSGFYIGSLRCQNAAVQSEGLWDAYVAKFDPSGQLLWLRSFGGSLNDIAYGLSVNSVGTVAVTGWFAGEISLENNIQLVSLGGSDIFCLTYDTNGEVQWARSAGTIGVDYAYKCAIDEQGNAYITGTAGVGTDFDGVILQTNGMYIAKYDEIGAIQWINGSSGAAVIGITSQSGLNPSDRGMVTGRLVGAGSIGQFVFETANHSNDAYWAEFDLESGTWLNVEIVGGNATDKARDGFYRDFPVMVGSFEETLITNGSTFQSIGAEDAFLFFRLDNQDHFAVASGLDIEAPTAVVVTSDGSIAVSGWHFGNSTFGNHSISSSSSSDQNLFVALYDTNPSLGDDLVTMPEPVYCYPNPFSDLLSIVFGQTKSPSSLEVFNIRGQLVRTIPIGDDKAGILVWDGYDDLAKPLPKGVYILRIDSVLIRVLKL